MIMMNNLALNNIHINFYICSELTNSKYDYHHKKGPRVKRYRQQQEYGEKMRIKP